MALPFFLQQVLKRSVLLDVETTGLDPSRHTPLGAAHGKFGGPIQETWFTYETAERTFEGPFYRKYGIKTEEEMIRSLEPFSLHEWNKSWNRARGKWLQRGGQPQRAMKYFSKVLAETARSGGFLWTHNVRFDITQFGSQFAHPAALELMYKGQAVPGWTKWDPYSGRVFPTTTKTAHRMRGLLYDKPQQAPSIMREWYRSYRQMMKGAAKAGKPAVFDSLAIAQAMMGMAQQRGAMRKTGDVFTGTSIEALATAFGVKPKGRAHLATTDVKTLRRIIPKILETTEALYKKKPLKPYQAEALKYLGEVQPEIAQRNVERMFAQAVLEKRGPEGKFRLRKGGYSRNLDDLVGVYKKFYKHRSYYDEGMLEETMSRVSQMSKSQLDHVLYARAKVPEQIGKGAAFRVSRSKIGASMRRFLANRNPYLLAGAAALGAMGAGALMLPDRKEHNTVEALRSEGMSGWQRKMMTDFGSGYRGPNPWLNPEYNKAQDIPGYTLIRASALGMSEQMLYRHLTRKPKESEYLAATAYAGTALHLLEEAMAKQGDARVERFVYDRVAGITGHVDVEQEGAAKDIKTLSDRRFHQIASQGPDPKHIHQINFYARQIEAEMGVLEYIKRSDPTKRVTYSIPYSEELYEADVEKVGRVRERIEDELGSGKLKKEQLRMTASLDTLREAATEEPPDYESDIPFLARTVTEEMTYLADTMMRSYRPQEAFGIMEGLAEGGLASYLRHVVTDFGSKYQAVLAMSRWVGRFESKQAARYLSQKEVKDMMVYLRSKIKESQLLRVGKSSFGLEMTPELLTEHVATLRKLEVAKGYKGGATILHSEYFEGITNRVQRVQELKSAIGHEGFHAAAKNQPILRQAIEKAPIPEHIQATLRAEGYNLSTGKGLYLEETSRSIEEYRYMIKEEAANFLVIPEATKVTHESVQHGVEGALKQIKDEQWLKDIQELHKKSTFQPVHVKSTQANTRRARMTTKVQRHNAPGGIRGVRLDDSPGVPGMPQKMHRNRSRSKHMYQR